MRRPMIRSRRKQRGFVLITVLWTGLALLLGVSAFMSTARQEALQVRGEVAILRASELARAGLNLALADLGRVSEGQVRSARDGTPVSMDMAEGRVTYRIQDEAGKLDIYLTPPAVLGPVLQNIGARAGVDAFDAVNVAQALQAASLRTRARPRSVGDALIEAGLPMQTARIAERYLTTFNFAGKVNPRTASETVLSAIPGLGPGDVAEILARRESGAQMPRLGSAAAWLAERAGPVYTITADAELSTGGKARLVALVASRGLAFRGGLMRFEVLSVRFEDGAI
ncbi:MAG: hypothetical protein AAF340_16675 [Pseudomonadota bacterium]